MKKQITLRFPSFTALWSFKTAIRVSFFEMSPASLLLTCDCSEEEIQLALSGYGAKVVEQKEKMANAALKE